MDRQELIERLKGYYEWNDVEFKRAQRNVPASAYETVSAFSNTEGGWLIFGVRDVAGGFEIVGVEEVDKVQNDFLSVLRSGQKLNRVIAVKERLIEEDGKALLAFHIPEARRQDKPVYLGGDIRQSFIRRGAGDERCTEIQLERLLRDAADERYDGEPLDLAPEQCFDDDSLRWYRKRFDDRNPGRHDETLSHLEFLYHWGLVVEIGSRLLPTRASVLLFGVERAVRQMLPRPVVDWQWHRRDWSDALPEEAPVFEIATRLKGRPGRTDQANDRTATERSDPVRDQPRSGRENLSTAQVGSRPPRLVTDQVSPGPPRLGTDRVPAPEYLDEAAWKVIMFCDEPRSLTDILVELGFAHRTFFRRAHLEPLLRSGVLRMTRPYKPNHPDQAYVLTEAGIALKGRRLNKRVAKTGRDRTNGG